MGAMVPPSRKSCYNFRVTEINRVLDGDTIDVTIDLGFDLYKKERVRIAGVDTPEKRTRDLEEKALGIDATNWLKEKLEGAIDGDIGRLKVTVAVQNFLFMGGSMGMSVGNSVIAGVNNSLKFKTPFVIFAAAGGARMQESILSLMQMPRSTVAIQSLREAKLPYVVVLTNPTTGGVTASYAMLGDITIAEPNALICFAGPRVIEQTIGEKLPDGFQKSEYLLDHGMVDMVIPRDKIRDELIVILHILMNKPRAIRGDIKEDTDQVNL